MLKSIIYATSLTVFSISLSYIYLYNRIVSINEIDQTPATKFVHEPPRLNQIYMANVTIDKRILLIIKSKSSPNVNELIKILEINHYKYKILQLNSTIDVAKFKLGTANRSFFSLMIFDQLPFASYRIIEHCQLFKIGIIYIKLHDVGEQIFEASNCNDCYLKYYENEFLKITKPLRNENVLLGNEMAPGNEQLFSYSAISDSYNSVIQCEKNGIDLVLKSRDDDTHLRQLIIGSNLDQLVPSLILDFFDYASYGRVSFKVDRYVQIDVDDIFVARTGIRMKEEDVYEIIEFQEKFLNKHIFDSEKVEGEHRFKFNLGFSGFYYLNGSHEENLADKLLIKKKDTFNWFDHTWSHYQPHLLNESILKEQMYLNYDFAIKHGLPVNSFYSISPHHSGIYPISQNLYKLWSDIWLIKASSTEGYPHQRPSHLRRGFIHENIMVMPRQTCGLYTHTNFRSDFPKGIDQTLSMKNGGNGIDVAKTLIYNRVTVFMTHWTNYGNDRLALELFRVVFEFILKWTNLKMKALPPVKLAEKYFEIYPENREALWTNVCTDKRHLTIWSLDKENCQNVPQFLIIGPQKTGTTALYTFLNYHPNLKSNKMTEVNFEETQFFSTQYHRGIDWYFQLFNRNFNTSSNLIFFEKSANYFSYNSSPIRIKTFFKENVMLIILTIDPTQRAYSWYQHMKSHGDKIANNFSFYEILTLNATNNLNNETLWRMNHLRERCLDPGLYYKHAKVWLKHFQSKQLIFLDGDLLKLKPSLVLDQLQTRLNIEPKINYKKRLIFDKKKGFYCLIINNQQKHKNSTRICLGSSKGRRYDRIDEKAKSYLDSFYAESNSKFLKLLKIKLNYSILPLWLKK